MQGCALLRQILCQGRHFGVKLLNTLRVLLLHITHRALVYRVPACLGERQRLLRSQEVACVGISVGERCRVSGTAAEPGFGLVGPPALYGLYR
jgi:hypothetical protein